MFSLLATAGTTDSSGETLTDQAGTGLIGTLFWLPLSKKVYIWFF